MDYNCIKCIFILQEAFTENCIAFLSLNTFVLRKSIALNIKKLVKSLTDWKLVELRDYSESTCTVCGEN